MKLIIEFKLLIYIPRVPDFPHRFRHPVHEKKRGNKE